MGRDVLQYSFRRVFGLLELISPAVHDKKNWISGRRYFNPKFSTGLDLMGKTFINEGDDVVIEEPAYLGAIQAFSIFRPRFNPVS